jgi:hypothetical protein
MTPSRRPPRLGQKLRLHRGGGRPKLPLDRRRCARLRLYLTTIERQRLDERARAADVSAPFLTRSLALYGQYTVAPVPRVNYAVVAQLAHLGSLLNQAIRRLNSGELPEDLRDLVTQTQELLMEVRRELVTPPPQ